MKYDVVAIGVDPESGRVIAGPRTERIDTETNEMFSDCAGPWDVEDRYEQFWNRLNDFWETDFPKGKEKVKVVRVDVVTHDATSLQAIYKPGHNGHQG